MENEAKRTRSQQLSNALGVLFRETTVPVIALGGDGAIVAANEATIGQYGYTIDELLVMRVHDLIADGRAIDGDLARAFREHGAPFERRPHRRKNGSVLWVVPNAGPITLDGETYVVSVLKDVTPLVEAETLARNATAAGLRDRKLILGAILEMLGEREVEPALQVLARAFLEAAGDATSVWIRDPALPGVLRMATCAGVAVERVSALGDERIVLARERMASRAWESGEAHVVRLEDTTDGSIEHTTSLRLGGHSFVAPLVGREGPHGIMYAHGRTGDDVDRALALATTLGRVGGMILEAVQLELRAKRDEERAEALWHVASERLSDGVALLDRELRVVRVNSAACAMLDVKPADILGKRCREVFSVCKDVDPCPHLVAQMEQLTLVREMQGVRRLLRLEIIPMAPNQADIAVIHVAHDLSDERAMRTRLLSADRLATIGRLAAGVAHEVNNPAAFVTLNLGVLRDRFIAGTARTAEVLPIVEESLDGMERIREIVHDLKGFARERSHDVVDLSQLALSAIRMATHETRGRAQVDRVLGEGIVAHARGARIAQVVLNLVVNAAQAIPPGNPLEHRIVVRTYRDGTRARLEVSDTGAGVPDDLKERIFEPFFTTHESTGGTGLGLWLARGIVEEQGGTIIVRDDPGGGACFVLDLPASLGAEAGLE